MRTFITDDFLLDTGSARELYHQYAADQPIIDYHCHLSPRDIADNRQFGDLYQIWLEGDHYKWRAMRANGEAERFCTGDATHREKFDAFARTVPHTLRNPLYHWTHLELKRYFGIDTLLGPETAESVWTEANQQLATPERRVWGILEQFRVQVIGTTDDPVDSLEYHRALAGSECPAQVVPTFRPDKAMALTDVTAWNGWVDRLEAASDTGCGDLAGFLTALERRHTDFHEMGGRASDHGLERCPVRVATEAEAALLFSELRAGGELEAERREALAGFLLCFVGELNYKRGWAMQLHLGAFRNVNRGAFERLGPDVGCDSIGDFEQARPLAGILGELSRRGRLPRTILYNLNPADNYLFATMAANFSEEGMPGKMQFGSGWWFLDQLEGMTWQLNALSNLGLLSRFVGMLTDSRSFMSFTRHEYFRRLLCNLLGSEVERGRLPRDMDLLGGLVRRVCHENARAYFGFPFQ